MIRWKEIRAWLISERFNIEVTRNTEDVLLRLSCWTRPGNCPESWNSNGSVEYIYFICTVCLADAIQSELTMYWSSLNLAGMLNSRVWKPLVPDPGM